MIGALVGMGVPEYEAKNYEESLKKGGVLLSARRGTPHQRTVAQRILQRRGAEGVCSIGDGSEEE